MTASKPIIVERTGEIFSMASSQFRVTYPDGHVDTIWSPPWHEMGPEQEAAEAARYAARLYADGSHMRQSCPDRANAAMQHLLQRLVEWGSDEGADDHWLQEIILDAREFMREFAARPSSPEDMEGEAETFTPLRTSTLTAIEEAQHSALALNEQDRVRFAEWFAEWHRLITPEATA